MLYRLLFTDEKNITRASGLWNAIFSILNALQSVVLMFMIARVCGDEDAGVFSFAFSVAYLLIMIGNYGVRNYQATDVRGLFSSRDYIIHRGITCVFMMLGSVIYILFKDYPPEKNYVILLACFLKMLESVEDVFHGLYQREGRLDVASKIGVVRYLLCILAFVIVLIISKDMVLSFLGMDLVSVVLLFVLLLYSYPKVMGKGSSHAVQEQTKAHGWIGIFKVCLPLFLATFFNIYICNAAKYAIDRYYSDTIQGYYGMLFMPVFVINLMCMCIYRPHLVELAEHWLSGRREKITAFMRKQMLYILLISAVVIIAGYFIGTQVLSWFYGTDLAGYKVVFAILLLGGGMTATVDFMNNIITIMRRQVVLIWLYGFVALLALIFTRILVAKLELMGAAISYAGILLVQAVIMTVYVVITMNKDSRNE